MGEQERMSLGRIAYEVIHHGHYSALPPAEQGEWESVGQAVKAAVLAEQEAPAEPQGMAHATTMRDRAIRELKEAVQDISRACVYRDALAAALEATAGRQKTGKKGRKRNE